MTNATLFILMGILLLAVVVGSFYAVRARRRSWFEVSEELGLNYDGVDRMHGTHRGVQISFEIERRSAGKNSYSVCVARARLASADPGFLIKQEGFGMKMLKFAGVAEELQVGHAPFDDRFFIQNGSEERLREWLTLERVGAFVDLVESNYEEIRLEAGEFCCVNRQHFHEVDELKGLIDFVVSIVSVLEGESAQLALGPGSSQARLPADSSPTVGANSLHDDDGEELW